MVGAASNPTLDVVPLNTKEFTEGITAPIDTGYVVYLFNKEQDDEHQSTIARLLFDKIRIVWRDGTDTHACSYVNNPDRQAPFASDSSCASAYEAVFGVAAPPLSRQDAHLPSRRPGAAVLHRRTQAGGSKVQRRLSGRDLFRSEGFASRSGRNPPRAYSVNRNCQYDALGRPSWRSTEAAGGPGFGDCRRVRPGDRLPGDRT
nr:hypothetical protein [uncultured Lichenicoccus sp.]